MLGSADKNSHFRVGIIQWNNSISSIPSDPIWLLRRA